MPKTIDVKSIIKGWKQSLLVTTRAGKKVMQFIQEGRYVAVVADEKVILYGKSTA